MCLWHVGSVTVLGVRMLRCVGTAVVLALSVALTLSSDRHRADGWSYGSNSCWNQPGLAWWVGSAPANCYAELPLAPVVTFLVTGGVLGFVIW